MSEPKEYLQDKTGEAERAERFAPAPLLPSGGESREAISCLLEVAQELNSANDLGSGLDRVAELVKRHVDYETLAVLLLDDLGRELRFEHAVGIPEEVTRHWRFGMGQGIVGMAAESGKGIYVADVSTERRYINASKSVRSELAIPLIAKDRTIGVLDVGGSRPGQFDEEDRRLLGFLADHLANAIESARLYQNMRDQAQTLSLLHEVSRELTSILDRKELVERVAELIKRLIDYDLFSVLLWNEETQLLEPAASVFGPAADGATPQAIPLGYGICGTVAALRQPQRVPNVHLDPRYVSCVADFQVGSELTVPLIFKDRLIGVLDLESSRYDAFTTRHQQLLSTLASSLAIALENARLYEKLAREERQLESDLSTAREVQRQLLPRATPWLPGIQLAVAYEPARHLGGDFFDFLPYGDNRMALAVGDVAGKATSAALYGSLAVGTLREYAVRSRREPARVLADMNEKLGRLGFDSRFIAMAFAVYDAPTRTLTLANSGLPYPYLLRGRSLRKIEVGGVPLGLLDDRSYEQTSLVLEPGDAVVIVSDGIEDSLDAEEKEFGARRMEDTLQRLARGSAMDIAQGLLEATQLHAGGARTYDDRTILAIKAV